MSLKEQLMADYKTAMKEHDVTTRRPSTSLEPLLSSTEVDQGRT